MVLHNEDLPSSWVLSRFLFRFWATRVLQLASATMNMPWQQYRDSSPSPSSPPSTAPKAWPAAAKYPTRLPSPAALCVDCPTPPVVCLSTDELTAQCTDQCVVITCDDPAHGEMTCHGGDDHAHCDLVCDAKTNCTDCNGFDAFVRLLLLSNETSLTISL